MEKTQTMMDPTALIGKVIEYLLAGAIGWLIASFSFQRRLDDFEKRVVGPIRDNVSQLEGASKVFVTREELKSEIQSLRTDFKEAVADVKSLIRELRAGQ
jgi:hypothetical protein